MLVATDNVATEGSQKVKRGQYMLLRPTGWIEVTENFKEN
jgi:hypothetical protein